MNVTKLSAAQLEKLQKESPREIEKRKMGEKKKLLKHLSALASAKGFSLKELLTSTTESNEKPSKRKPVAIKYRHPADASLTWTGRGRKPKWIVEWLSQGKAIETLSS